MKGDQISSDHHIAIYCSATRLFIDPEGIPVGLQPDALRADDDGISCNWIEYFLQCWSDQLLRTRYVMALYMTVRRTGRMAVAHIRILKGAAAQSEQTIGIEHDPLPKNDAHSLIIGQGLQDDDGLAALLATKFLIRPIFLTPSQIDDISESMQDNYRR